MIPHENHLSSVNGVGPTKKLAIIGNPNAGQKNLARIFRQGSHTLWGWPCEYIVPASAQKLTETCAALSPHIYEAAIVIGGDGTVHHAIRGLLQNQLQIPSIPQVPLFTFPGGTANDLATELGINLDWTSAQKMINEQSSEMIDLIEVNGIPFATVAGVGLGAIMTEDYLNSFIVLLEKKSTLLWRFARLHSTGARRD